MEPQAFLHFIDCLLDAPVIAVDTETTGIEGIKDGRAWLTGISVAFRHPLFGVMSAYFPFRHPDDNLGHEELKKVKMFLEMPEKHLVFHNLKFDLFSLKSIGIVPRGRLYDTAVIAHMINEEWPSKKLDWLSRYLLNDHKDDKVVRAWAETWGWAKVPAKVMAPYAKHDAELTLALFELLWPQMKEQELAGLWPREVAFSDVLYGIETVGLRADLDFCERKVERGTECMASIESTLGFRPSSPIDLGKFLLDELGLPKFDKNGKRTDGKPSFAKKAMEEYDLILARDGRKEAQLVVEYRGWQRAVSALYTSILEKVSPDGRIRTDFNMARARTGRLSSSGPNLQQIPRNANNEWNGDAKCAFIETDGTTLLEFDYSQLEFRLATAYGRDSVLLDVFERNEDPFIPTAIAVFGGPEFRQSTKTLTYSTLYGAGNERIMNALGLSSEKAQEIRGRFRDTYPGIYNASKTAEYQAKTKGYVRYWTGRRRHFEIPAFAYKAFNSVIQGGGAELVKDALLRVSNSVVDNNRRIVLTVHDSIVMEVAHGFEEQTIKEVTDCMTDFPDFGVNLAVDAKVWGTK